MRSFKPIMHSFIAISCALSIQSKSFAEPANLSQLKQAVETYHDSGTYQKDLKRIAENARNYLLKRVAANAKAGNPQKLALVLDIDETSISNYNHLHARDFGYNQQKWDENLLAADAPAIEPVLSLYRTALQQHVAVFFVTGRTELLKKATSANLKLAGYQDWAALYTKPNDYKQPSIIPFKVQARADITQKGFTIIESIGDQASDLTGGYAEKTYKLPNPYYYIS